MNSNDAHGTLLFFRKNGQAGTSYPLCSGKTTLGSSEDADIRLKFNDERLELIHCIIDVNDSGIATLLNKSHKAPVKVNTICVRKIKVLNHEDKIELIGKQFQYLNENLSSKDVARHQKILNKAVLTPNRHSPLVKLKTKKSPNLRTKTPFQKRTSIRKSFAGSSTEFVVSVTPAKNPDRKSVIEKSKTTSKVVVSKALGSPRPKSKRRLSLGNNHTEISESPKISTKNILLSENIVSSTITEEEEPAPPKPSVSMKNHEESREAGGFLDESNVTVENSPPKKKTCLRTPSKSSTKITVTEATPNKIMGSLKMPRSFSRASLPSSPRALRPTKKIHRSKSISKFDNSFSNVGTPIKKLPENRKSSIKKNYEETEASVDETVMKELTKPQHRSSKLIDINEENLIQSSLKNIPRRATLEVKGMPTNVDSEDVSSDESIMLNLSSDSSVSPMKRLSRTSLLSSGDKYSSNDNSSPRRSILKKSLGKSQLDGVKLSLNRPEEVHSSSEELDLEWKTNDPQEDSFQNKSAAKSRRSLMSNKQAEEEVEETHSSSEESSEFLKGGSNHSGSSRAEQKEDTAMQKSATKSRRSLRRSKITEDQFETQSSSEESSESPVRGSNTSEQENNSMQRAVTQSRQSLRRSKMTEDQFETQSSSEESLQLNTKKDSTVAHIEANGRESSASTKVRQSLRKNNTTTELSLVQTPNMSIATFSRAEESFLVTETNSPYMSMTRSNIMEDIEMQVSSGSESPDKSKNGSPRKSVGRTSRQSLRKSSIVKGENSVLTSDSDSPAKSSKSRRSNSLRADMGMTSSSEDSLHLRLSESPQLSRSNVSAGPQSQRTSTPNDNSSSENGEQFEEEQQSRRSSMRKSKERSKVSAEMSNEQDSSMRKSPRARESEGGLKESVPIANITTRRTSLRQSARSAKINEERSLNEKSEKKVLSSDDEHLENHMPIVEMPKELNSSVRKSSRISKRRESEAVSNTVNITKTETPSQRQSSARKSVRINEEQSLKEESLLSKNEANEPSSSEDESLEYSLMSSETPKEQNLSMRKSTRASTARNSKAHRSNQDISAANITATQTPTQRRYSVRKSVQSDKEESSLFENDDAVLLSAEDESAYSDGTPGDRDTPKLRHSSVRKSHLSQSENEVSDTETSPNKSSTVRRNSMNKSTPISKTRRASLGASSQNISVITLNDSIDNTPENNTSVIILDTSLKKTRRSTHKKLSKTMNSTIQDDVELTTPKSVIRSRRSKSLPYNPIIEDITPVSPLSNSTGVSGFKTPLNTPGLFENIRKSVLKSRSRSQRSSNNLMEELNKEEPVVKAVKRPRESSGSFARSNKRRKVTDVQSDASFGTDSEDNSTSFGSFRTEDVLSDISDQNVCQKTPEHFKDLTDKPVINEPRTRSLTEPRKVRASSLRRSLHAMRLESQLSSHVDSSQKSDGVISATSFSSELSDMVFEISTDSNTSSRRSSRRSSSLQSIEEQDLPKKVQKSPKNDLSDVAGLKKLLKTPKEQKSPKNDLTDVRGVKKLLQTPKAMNSPKNDLTNVPNLRKLMSPKAVSSPNNDLTNIVGVKKLFSTPREIKSPKNDLRKVPNLRRLMSPKQQNSPKNDLSDVAGLKKLLSSPKQVKSPDNDLRNVPSLRRLMSPKVQNSPRNDLRNIAGIKKLMSTPKAQNSPRNDLTDIPNLRRIMSPKQQNSPKNDLTDVRGLKRLMKTPRKYREPVNDLTNVEGVASVFNMPGVQRLSNESDIENNEDLFDKLFAKRPLKTYRGKSLSPTTRKSILFSDQRKTLGDTPLTSPRVERWVEEQAIIKAGNDNEVFEDKKFESPKGSRWANKEEERGTTKVKRQKNDVGKVTEESNIDSARGKRRKRVGEKKFHEENDKGELQEQENDNLYVGEEVTVTITSKERKLAEESKVDSPRGGRRRRVVKDETKEEEKVPRRGLRGQKRLEEIVDVENKPDSPRRTPRGRSKVTQAENKPKGTSTLLAEVILIEESTSAEAETKKKPTRSRKKADKATSEMTDDREETEVDSTSTVNFQPPPARQGRPKKVGQKKDSEDQIAEVHSTTEEITSPETKRGRTRQAAEMEEKNDNTSTDTEIVAVAPRRGRARNIPLSERTDSTEDLTVKPLRGRAESKEEEVQLPRPTRGKKKTPVDNSGEVEIMPDVVEVSIKRGKRKNVTSVEEENMEKRGRGVKLANIDGGADEESENSVISTRKTRLRKEDAVEVTPSKKPSRSRKVAVNVETEELSNSKEIVTEELRRTKVEKSVKNTRGRRAPKQSEEEVETLEVVKKGRGKKKVEETEYHQETKDAKPTKTVRSTRRGAKNVEIEQEEDTEGALSPVVVKKPTRSRNKTSEENTKEDIKETEPTKSTRSRRQKTQDQPKETEVTEDVITKPTNKRTRGKAFEEETVDIDSPRTARAKRGNFKKYGSDFVTETSSPKREGKSKKTVHFEEVEASEEGGHSKKPRGRNALKVEENEETARRSKRTRK